MSDAAAETHAFQAEVSALLRLVTHSLYTNREIFLRELVSNASDALDRARFLALVEPDLNGKDLDSAIDITVDKANRTLTIEDTGIGMTREEAVKNLGTIAHSGTKRFMEEAKKAEDEGKKLDLNLIGQFGVGFYSALMVADRVDVESLSGRAGSEPIHWSTDGEGAYSLSAGTRKTRGTRITLHLKADTDEFLDRHRIRHVVKHYSNYVMHPISVQVTGAGDDDSEPERINDGTAVWSRRPADVEEDDYAEFYKHVMGGFVLPGDEALGRLHIRLDAPIQFQSLLFVPSRAPADLFMEDRKALQLYAQRVMIMESCDSLLPSYLRFFRGVVDSEDLPLNVSREMLQEHKALSAIRRQLTRKALGLLEDTAKEDAERYGKIWKEFGTVIREGIHTDNSHREKLSELLRYPTASQPDGLSSLAAYVEAMPEGQEDIYYITGDTAFCLSKSPQLEAFRAKGYDVLLMSDAVDEWVVQSLTEYQGKKLVSVTQDDVKPGEHEADAKAIETLVGRAKEILGERVSDVRASSRLHDSASCLVDAAGGLSRNMERILRAANRNVPSTARILELNPGHAFVKAAEGLAANEPKSERLTAWVELLLDQANLAEGTVPDPAATVRRIQAVLDEVATRSPTP